LTTCINWFFSPRTAGRPAPLQTPAPPRSPRAMRITLLDHLVQVHRAKLDRAMLPCSSCERSRISSTMRAGLGTFQDRAIVLAPPVAVIEQIDVQFQVGDRVRSSCETSG
jgi:hypothetical protein